MRFHRRRGLGLLLAAVLVPACSDGDRIPKDPPAAPTGLTATRRPLARVDLSWTDPDALEAAFLIERSIDGISFTQIAQVPQNATTYTDLNLQAATLYHYRVRGLGVTWGPYSNIATVTTSDLWVQPAVTGGPGPRMGAAAIYDPVRQRMIVVGGVDDTPTFHNDVWALSLPAPPAVPTWTRLLSDGDSNAPAGRFGAGAVYDPVGDQLVLYGGQDNTGIYVSDVHFLSLGGSPAWSLPSIPNAAATWGTDGHLFPAVLFDPTRRQVLVYGGEDTSSGLRQDVAALDLATLFWISLAPSTPPLGRAQMAAVFDPVRDRAAVFGGYDNEFSDSNLANGETRLLTRSPTAWLSPAVNSGPPLSRGMGAVLDAPNRRMVFWSGDDTQSSGPFHRELWALDLDTTTWTRLVASSPMPGRIHTCAVYDALHARLVIFGGQEDTGPAVSTVEWIGL